MLFFACSEQSEPYLEPVEEDAFAIAGNETLVSAEQAAGVAEAFFRSQDNEGIKTKSDAGLLKSPTSIEVIKADTETPLAYILNYPEGGFAIVSATRDYHPVLAYSDEGSFEITPDMGPVAWWLEDTKEAIRQSAASGEEDKLYARRMWI
jgi:hypothetical protein